MSAPPPEGQAEASESVIIKVKVESTIEIDQQWLSSDFFEAQLERWQREGQSQPQITLKVPEGCDPSEGARLLKLRLSSEYSRKKQNPASTAQERAWSPVDWWKATKGCSSLLFGALHLFDFISEKGFATEVAETLELYRVKCPGWAVRIAQEHQVSVQELKPIKPRTSDLEMLGELLVAALEHDTNTRHQTLVEQALVGCEDSPIYVMRALVQAWFSLFLWKSRPQTVTGNAAPNRPIFGTPIQRNNALPWLLGLVELFVLLHPTTASVCDEALFYRLRRGAYGKYEVLRANGTTSEYHVASFDWDNVDRLRAICAHSLFIKSSFDWSGTRSAFEEFCYWSCAMPGYYLADGCYVLTRPFIDPRVFAIAHPEAQFFWLRASPAWSLAVFKDSAHLVHSFVRHFLLRNPSVLSDKDMDWLANVETASEEDD